MAETSDGRFEGRGTTAADADVDDCLRRTVDPDRESDIFTSDVADRSVDRREADCVVGAVVRARSIGTDVLDAVPEVDFESFDSFESLLIDGSRPTKLED